MIKLGSIVVMLGLLGGVAAADASFIDNHQTATVDCAKDATVNISGNEATITLTGVCENVVIAGNKAKLTGSAKNVLVAGNQNSVDLDVVDQLSVAGNKNTVRYKSSSDPKKKPKVSNTGNKNKVSKKK
ncbi:MAG: DUF3060 domain-containing protein [Kofleriaceae bacterium]